VTVSEHAGPDLVAIAAEEAFRNPWAVVFPFRYLGGARFYKENNPEVTVVVMGGRNPVPLGLEDTGITYVRTDIKTDLLRAGLSAALLAGEKNILLFDDGLFPEEYRELLAELLESRGFLGEIVLRSVYAHIPSFAEIGSVIIPGPATRFLEQNLDIPTVLFSWADPGFTPLSVKLVFDDSPWALVAKALKNNGSDEIFLPSAPAVLPDRIEEKRDFRKLRDLVQEKF
jgi:hypothetical protein